MRFDYRLTGTGWASATIADDAASATMTASYLGDALGDLLLAVLALFEGKAETCCSWWEEPGEYRWLFRREGDQIAVRVIEFPRLWGGKPDDSGHLLFETTQPLRALAASIAATADALIAEYGLDGYRAKWVEHDFPSESLASINHALAE